MPAVTSPVENAATALSRRFGISARSPDHRHIGGLPQTSDRPDLRPLPGAPYIRALSMNLDPDLLQRLAAKVGTPFWLYDARIIRQRIQDVCFMSKAPGVQARFAMKACPATRVLREMKQAGIWIDAVSGNEALRALRAGFSRGNQPPEIC